MTAEKKKNSTNGKEEMEMNWYVVHTMTGSEEFVAKAIRERAEKEGIADEIGEILVPTEKVIEVKNGEKKVVTKRSFPGYIIIQMVLNDKNQNIIKNVPKVTGFVGAEGKPVPLTEKEVKRIISHIESTDKKPMPKYKFERGEAVRIIDGPFLNFNGVIEEVDEKRQVLKVTVTIFGRATPVELDFLQVEKI